MQFYIIHDDPKISCKLMPDYGIKTNVREAYTMLCDMGHLFKVCWEGQHKEYNPYHAETRQYWRNIKCFDYFIAHYEQCLVEYELRYWNQTKFHDRYFSYQRNASAKLRGAIMARSSKYNQVIKYLLDRKTQHLKPKEITTLQSIV
jgi:hypothetical protein